MAKAKVEQGEEIVQLKPAQEITTLEAMREGIQTIAPGLSPTKMAGDVWEELKHLGAQGAHELAAGMFRGHDAFVMYPKAGQEDKQGISAAIEAIQQQGGVHGNEGHGLPEQVNEQQRGNEGREA